MVGFPFGQQTPSFPLGEDDKRMALIQGLLAGGGALMQAGGPSTSPVSAGQALGAGIGQATNAFMGAQKNAQQNRYMAMQTAALGAQAAQARRKAEVLARIGGGGPLGEGTQTASLGPMAPQQQGPQFPLGGQNLSLGDMAALDDDFLSKYAMEGMKPPQTREVQKGREKITEQFDPATRTWQEIGRGSMDAPDKGPEDVRKYEYAKGQGFKGSFEDWVRMEKAASGAQEQYGLTPIWGTDEQGSPVLMQPSNRGGVNKVNLPPGVTPQRGQTSRVDLGTQYGILDANGTLIGYLPKDVKGEAAQRAVGTTQGELQAAAPGGIVKADQILRTIDDVLDDPALSGSVGLYSYLQGIPGSKQMAFGLKAKQLEGQAFLQAFESLKGGGAITQIEGEKATQAIGRLNTAQDEKSYRAALTDLRNIVTSARGRLANVAKGGQTDVSAPTVPPPSLNTPKSPSGFSIRRID